MATRAQDLAMAYEHVSQINHYCVGVVGAFTDDERDQAEQILIEKQNALSNYGEAYQRRNKWRLVIFERALDLLTQDRKAG